MPTIASPHQVSPRETSGGLLREQAYIELKKLICTGELAKMPFVSERKLAKLLGMSNTPVRSAVEKLETEGMRSNFSCGFTSNRSVGEHRQVVDLLEAGNSPAACEAMMQHLQSGLSVLLPNHHAEVFG